MNDPGIIEEVARIEHELGILRERHARFVYWSGVVRVWVIFFGIFLAVVGLASSAYVCMQAFTYDFTIGVFAAGMSAVVLALAWLSWRAIKVSPTGWIDLVSQQRGPSWGGGLSGGRYVSEAEAIEDMITNREARLTVLQGLSDHRAD